MPDNKQKCKNCKNRHVPPTGKKCPYVNNVQNDVDVLPNGLRDAAVTISTTSQHTGQASTSSSGLGKLSTDINFSDSSKSSPSKSKKVKSSHPQYSQVIRPQMRVTVLLC